MKGLGYTDSILVLQDDNYSLRSSLTGAMLVMGDMSAHLKAEDKQPCLLLQEEDISPTKIKADLRLPYFYSISCSAHGICKGKLFIAES